MSGPCNQRTRRVPNWKSDQRNIPRGSFEDVLSRRYVKGEDPETPCRLAREGERGRCYSEGNMKRKNCKILLPEGSTLLFPPGLHVWGVSQHLREGVSPEFTCLLQDRTNFTDDRFINSRSNPPPAGSMVVLGPYLTPGGRFAVKCISTSDLNIVSDQDPAGMMRSIFSTIDGEMDFTIPSLRDVTLAVQQFQELGNVPPIIESYSRYMMRIHSSMLDASRTGGQAFMKVLRLFARLFFNLGMYLRRWAGPGTPYPISREYTQIMVGSGRNPVSDSLVDMRVSFTLNGIRVLDGGETSAFPMADTVGEEGRLENMEYAHMQCLIELYHSLGEGEKMAARNLFRRGMTAPVANEDGNFVTSESESLFDVCFLMNFSIANANRCVRISSGEIVQGVLVSLPYLYKTRPTWSRYEGYLADVA